MERVGIRRRKRGACLVRLCGRLVPLLCLGATTACVRTSTSKVRKAETTLCAESVVAVVEVVPDVGNRHILEPLRAQFQTRGVRPHVVDVEDITDLRHPNISGPIGTHQPQAVLVVDWMRADLTTIPVAHSGNQNVFKLSLFEYTEQRNLVEVWQSKLHSARTLTAHVGLEPKDGEAIAEQIVEELGKSHLIAPCDEMDRN
jgi:hypothetical protein